MLDYLAIAVSQIASHAHHILHLAQFIVDRIDLIQTRDFERRGNDSALHRGIRRRSHRGHINTGVGDDRGHIAQQARAVASNHNSGYEEMLRLDL